jgi:predicted nucleic acid-binding protein
MTRVVDASAIGAVLFVEHEAAWVNEQTNGIDLLAPVILPFEIGNICWKKLRQSASDADRVMVLWTAWTESLPVRLAQPNPVDTLRLAHETGLTFYDASYLRLAQERDADLISLDARLVRAARTLGLHAPAPGDANLPPTAPRSRN